MALTKSQRQIIQDVIEHATLERARFDQPRYIDADPLPTSEAQVTDFIRHRTARFRDSWIIAPLRELLAQDLRAVRARRRA